MAHPSLDGVPQLYHLGTVPIKLTSNTPSFSHSAASSSNQSTPEEWHRCLEEQTIDQVDCAQVTVFRPNPPNHTPLFAVHVSIFGIKCIEPSTNRCIERLAMHKIIECISYEADHDDLINLIILVQGESSNVGIAYVFQTNIAETTDLLCSQVGKAFDMLEEEARIRSQEENQRRDQIRREREEQKRLKRAQLPPISPKSK